MSAVVIPVPSGSCHSCFSSCQPLPTQPSWWHLKQTAPLGHWRKTAARSLWWDRFVEQQGRTPEYVALEAYRNADIVVKALELAGRDLTVDSLIAALESIDDYEDIFGYRVSFAPGQHKGVTESALSQIKDGRWHTLEESTTY